jgi:hypothetical protein
LASLSYILGAAVIYFELPTSKFLRKAFVGGAALYERKAAQAPSNHQQLRMSVGQIDDPKRTCDGFTLCMYGGKTQAMLVNMHGEEVHRWHIPFSKIWPDPPHLHGRIRDASVYFNDGFLFPNGDLLVVIEGEGDFSAAHLGNPSNGFGLAKLDKDSNLLWKYAKFCHHDLDVGDDGTVYAISQEFVDAVPPELEYLPTPCMVDFVEILTADGKAVKKISLLEALNGTAYAPILCPLESSLAADGSAHPGTMMSMFRDDERRMDVLHANSVKVLSRALASRFPMFKAGQLLVSLRHLDAIVVIDPGSGKAVWAARGPWRAQHDPTFLDNGHLLLFDNLGSPRGSRALEYDPLTQAFPWSFPGAKGQPFLSRIRGLSQRLPNGNTLITNSVAGEVFEVTHDQEVVWSCSCGSTLYRARRYVPPQLPFLKEAQHARP